MDEVVTPRQPVPADQLMAKPALTWAEFWKDLLGLPDSTAEVVAKGDNPPKFFLLGRRRYIRTADAVAWIDSIADASQYIPRRNRINTAKAVPALVPAPVPVLKAAPEPDREAAAAPRADHDKPGSKKMRAREGAT